MNIPKLNLKDYENESQLVWMVNNIRLPKGAAWDFSDRPWQLDIIEDGGKYIVVRKPTQVGLSTVFLSKMLYFADKHQCRLMYTLPRGDDISDMVYSRLQEIIDESPYIREKMSGVDNVRMKHYGKSWIHFAEMSVPPRMMDVDWMINDEVDLSNQDHLEQAASRMDASKLGHRHRISTPSIENFGIDAIFKLSDQKHWVVTCAYCSFDQVMNWEENVINHNDKTSYVCARCHNPLYPDDIREGRWVAMGKSNSLLSGYQISHLMIPYLDPEKLWLESKTMSTKTFYNFRLGLPYTPSSGSITKELLYEHCFIDQHKREYASKNTNDIYVIGADQGNTITYSVGKVTPEGRIQIVALGEIPFEDGFEELKHIIGRYNARKTVLDALPNHHSAMTTAQEFNGRVLIGYFVGILETYRVVDNLKININKTDAYDSVLSAITAGKIQFYISGDKVDPITEKAIEHLANMRRDIIQTINRATGRTATHIWKNTGPDHFADAILYMYMAANVATGDNVSLSVVDLSDPAAYGEFNDSKNMLMEDEFFDPRRAKEVIAERGFSVDINKESMTRITAQVLTPDNPYKVKRMESMGYFDEYFNQ